MAIKKNEKCYVVVRGRKTGIMKTEGQFNNAIRGYPNAKGKKCKNFQEAEAYLLKYQKKNSVVLFQGDKPVVYNITEPLTLYDKEVLEGKIIPDEAIDKNIEEQLEENEKKLKSDIGNETTNDSTILEDFEKKKSEALLYTDGSYIDGYDSYGCGALLVTENEMISICHNEKDQYLISGKNVSGELHSVILGLKEAKALNIKSVDIFYDFSGVEDFVNGTIKSYSAFTAGYVSFMKNIIQELDVHFYKVKSHSNNEGNNIADHLAKKAILNDLQNNKTVYSYSDNMEEICEMLISEKKKNKENKSEMKTENSNQNLKYVKRYLNGLFYSYGATLQSIDNTRVHCNIKNYNIRLDLPDIDNFSELHFFFLDLQNKLYLIHENIKTVEELFFLNIIVPSNETLYSVLKSFSL